MEEQRVWMPTKSQFFGMLLENKYDRLLKLAYRHTECWHGAEDSVQDASIRILRLLDRIVSPVQMTRWLYRATVHCAIDYNRKGSRYILQEDAGLSCRYAASMDDLPEKILMNGEARQIMRGCLGALNPDYQRIIAQKHFQGLAYKEISLCTGIKESTLRSHYHRACKELKKNLQDFQTYFKT